MQWFAQAPANIALIKYMGKKNGDTNIPDNASLSYTLNNLLTSVSLESTTARQDFWEPLPSPGVGDFKLSAAAQQRFLSHLARLKAYFSYTGGFVVRSSNNFPLGSGLASSASSFAALTKCAVMALSELTAKALPSIEEQACLSRLGSGSSCRSFFSPWAMWEGEEVISVDLPYRALIHHVVVISHDEKAVSSSEAHRRVQSSPQYAGRPARAEENLKTLLEVMRASDWESAYKICWREFQDMHHLFETCEKPFTYMTDRSKDVLKGLGDLWARKGDGPLVTMDAGPNIHLLYREDQQDLAAHFMQDFLLGNYDVL